MSIRLENERLGLELLLAGGSIGRFFGKRSGAEVPLLRQPRAAEPACFPLVPFGNRVRDNRFAFEGATYTLWPNTPSDPHYLHGDGWLSEWRAERRCATEAVLSLHHEGGLTPYAYDAAQSFALDGASLRMTLTVVNRGPAALPFGLGWHPFFPLTPRTTLRARATRHWREGEGWLPTTEAPLPVALDFNAPRRPPRHWVNNGFEGWDGECEITWPERGARLRLTADALFRRYLLFVSDPAFDPDYAYDFFCFEPMSHAANALAMPGDHGLRRLAPGEALAGSMTLCAEL